MIYDDLREEPVKGMTTEQVAAVFDAKRVGKGKYRAACPIHGGKRSGPLSIRDGDRWVLVGCFGGCDTADVLKAVGLTISQLAYNERVKIDSEVSRALRRKQAAQRLPKELLEQRLGLAIVRNAQSHR